MISQRIHLFGASGSGTTTLGRVLADALGVPHLDADDYYWQRSDPPFIAKNAPAERVRAIERDVAAEQGWVLSGSVCSWGDRLIPRFTLAVFLYLDPGERMARLAARERARYGERLLPGGDMHRQSREFLAWAESYDTAAPSIRSLALHELWMKRLPCPVMRLDTAVSTHSLVASVMKRLGETA